MKSMHQHYAIAFAGDSFGFALYHPRPASDLRPGACGYFNDKGVWETLFNLYATPGDPYAVPKNMYVAAGLGDEGSIVRHNFPEKVSHSMRRIEMAGEARIAVNGVEGGVHYEYQNTSSAGAILLTSGFDESYLSSPNSAFKRFIEVNGSELLRLYPNIKDFGFCIIRKTYATTKWALQCSTTKDQTIKFVMDVAADGFGRAGGGISWGRTREMGGWQFSPKPETQGWLNWALGGMKWFLGNTIERRHVEPPQIEQQQWVVMMDAPYYRHSKLSRVLPMQSLKHTKTPVTFGAEDHEDLFEEVGMAEVFSSWDSETCNSQLERA